MADIERLNSYYPFSEETLATVEDAAEWQNAKSFSELADYYHVDDGSVRTNVDGRPIEYLHLVNGRADNDDVSLLFAPMGNGALNENIVMRSLRWFEADGPAHLFVAAGPAHAGNPANLQTRGERKLVRTSDFSPLAVPMLKELGRLKLRQADVYGYSLGAEIGQAAARVAPHYDIDVRRAVLAEPVSTAKRTQFNLLRDFIGTGQQLNRYIDEAGSPPLREAHALARDDEHYLMGLLRLSSLAIYRGLGRGNFFAAQTLAEVANPKFDTTIAYGTASEISNPSQIKAARNGDDHRHFMPLEGMPHAGGDDIDLHAAIMMDGLTLATR